MKDKLTPRNIILCVVICSLPWFLFGIDEISSLLKQYKISFGWPGGDYVLRIIVRACLYMLLAIGLNIVCGFTGLLDLGYVVFYLIGGYTAGILMALLGVHYWIALPLAMAHASAWGLLRGIPTLRLTGDYFAIVTFGFAELFVRIVKNEDWLTGGDPNGLLLGIPAPRIPFTEFSFNDNWHNYYHIIILLALVIFVTYRLQNSRVGRAWVAIREDEQAAESMGINVGRYKSLAFAVSAAIGGIGGAFIAQFQSTISASLFEFWESIFILCMVVLGGMGSIRGAMLGAVILGSLGEILRLALNNYPKFAGSRYLIFGLILVLLMRFRPSGLMYRKK